MTTMFLHQLSIAESLEMFVEYPSSSGSATILLLYPPQRIPRIVPVSTDAVDTAFLVHRMQSLSRHLQSARNMETHSGARTDVRHNAIGYDVDDVNFFEISR